MQDTLLFVKSPQKGLQVEMDFSIASLMALKGSLLSASLRKLLQSIDGDGPPLGPVVAESEPPLGPSVAVAGPSPDEAGGGPPLGAGGAGGLLLVKPGSKGLVATTFEINGEKVRSKARGDLRDRILTRK